MDMDQKTLTPVCDGVMFGGYLVGTLFIILRLVCRLRLSGAGLWWDDYVLFLGCVCLPYSMILSKYVPDC